MHVNGLSLIVFSDIWWSAAQGKKESLDGGALDLNWFCRDSWTETGARRKEEESSVGLV